MPLYNSKSTRVSAVFRHAYEFSNAPDHQLWCCSICFGMPNKALKACFKRIQKSGHATNCGTHLKDVHKMEISQKAGSVPSTPNDASSKKRSLSSLHQYLRDPDSVSAITEVPADVAVLTKKRSSLALPTMHPSLARIRS
jgi:hypothetical protein